MLTCVGSGEDFCSKSMRCSNINPTDCLHWSRIDSSCFFTSAHGCSQKKCRSETKKLVISCQLPHRKLWCHDVFLLTVQRDLLFSLKNGENLRWRSRDWALWYPKWIKIWTSTADGDRRYFPSGCPIFLRYFCGPWDEYSPVVHFHTIKTQGW
jgi:hypothetical protein